MLELTDDELIHINGGGDVNVKGLGAGMFAMGSGIAGASRHIPIVPVKVFSVVVGFGLMGAGLTTIGLSAKDEN